MSELKPYTVVMPKHTVSDLPAENEEDARIKAWEWRRDKLDEFEVTEQDDVNEPGAIEAGG